MRYILINLVYEVSTRGSPFYPQHGRLSGPFQMLFQRYYPRQTTRLLVKNSSMNKMTEK